VQVSIKILSGLSAQSLIAFVHAMKLTHEDYIYDPMYLHRRFWDVRSDDTGSGDYSGGSADR
jgi:hypothetical protein